MTLGFRKTVGIVLALTMLVVSFATPASALDRRVRIVNNTGYTLVEFYGSNKGSNSWEEDILGYDVIGPYSSLIINFNDGSGYCIFDFRAKFDNGADIKDFGINVCEIGTFTYN